MLSQVFGGLGTCSDLFGLIRMRAFGSVLKRLDNFHKIFANRSKNMCFGIFARFLRSYAKTDVASSFLDIFCSRLTSSELGATLGGYKNSEKPKWKKVQTLDGRLPPEDGSDWPQNLGKRVSDDSRHFIFRRPKKIFDEIFGAKSPDEIKSRYFGGATLV